MRSPHPHDGQNRSAAWEPRVRAPAASTTSCYVKPQVKSGRRWSGHRSGAVRSHPGTFLEADSNGRVEPPELRHDRHGGFEVMTSDTVDATAPGGGGPAAGRRAVRARPLSGL